MQGVRFFKMGFKWDANKAGINIERHGVTFDEATTVFLDEISATVPDPDHSIEEEGYYLCAFSL